MDKPLPVVPREIAWDCRFFLGDRPCVWHKRSGVLCTCDHYEKIEERILIVKLDAMGDVLRIKQQLTGAKTSIDKGSEILDAMATATTPRSSRSRMSCILHDVHDPQSASASMTRSHSFLICCFNSGGARIEKRGFR